MTIYIITTVYLIFAHIYMSSMCNIAPLPLCLMPSIRLFCHPVCL